VASVVRDSGEVLGCCEVTGRGEVFGCTEEGSFDEAGDSSAEVEVEGDWEPALQLPPIFY
jgi:hypothetical protein